MYIPFHSLYLLGLIFCKFCINQNIRIIPNFEIKLKRIPFLRQVEQLRYSAAILKTESTSTTRLVCWWTPAFVNIPVQPLWDRVTGHGTSAGASTGTNDVQSSGLACSTQLGTDLAGVDRTTALSHDWNQIQGLVSQHKRRCLIPTDGRF